MKKQRNNSLVEEKIVLSEHEIQKQCFDWVRLKAPLDWRYKLIYAVPNGAYYGGRIGVAVKQKAEGLTKGIWDVNVDVPLRGFPGLRIEFKREGGKLSKEQSDYGLLYKKAGYLTYIITNFEMFKLVIESYFKDGEKVHI